MGFLFNFEDVSKINHISGVREGQISNVDCPFCKGKKKLNINALAGVDVARCNKCGWGGGMLQFHADLNGLQNLKEAKADIEEKLGLSGMPSDARRKRKAVLETAAVAHRGKAAELSLDERNRLNRILISKLGLDDDHRSDLRRRGLSDEFIESHGYRTIPVEAEGRSRIARLIQEDGSSVRYLPGFSKEDGDYAIRKMKRGYLIPVRSLNGRIEGFQIRKDNALLKYKTHTDLNGDIILDGSGKPKMFPENKFVTLSSTGMEDGGTMHSVCHYAGPLIWDDERGDVIPEIRKNRIKFTEGPLKADVYYHLTGEPMLAVMGVNNVKQLKKMLAQLREYYPEVDTVENCFDMDYLENPHVLDAVKKVEKMASDMGFRYIRRTWDPNFKGIDDFALAVESGIYG